MNTATHSWFHCSACGSFYRGPADYDPRRRCDRCHEAAERDPLVDEADAFRRERGKASFGSNRPVMRMLGRVDTQEKLVRVKKANRAVQRRKLIQLWMAMACLCLTVFGATIAWLKFGRVSKTQESSTSSAATSAAEIAQAREEREWLMQAVPLCSRALNEFYQKLSGAERAQVVYRAVEQVGPMERFYSSNTPYRPDSEPKLLHVSRVEIPQQEAVEILLGYEDGKKVEATFIKEDNEWRLDWRNFVRYSDAYWPMFLAGAGADEGEFRLWVRERLGDSRMRDEKNLSVAFIAPVFGSLDGRGSVSPEVLVPRDSEAGERLMRIFAAHREKKNAFHAKLPAADPQGLVRVRVKIRRNKDDEGKWKLELLAVNAAHWLSVEDDGIAPLPASAAGASK